MRWRSIGIGNDLDQSSAEIESRNVERVMVAAARQILDDKAKETKEKEPIRPHEPRQKGSDKEKMEVNELRRELADLKNQINQQTGNGGKYQDRPFQSQAIWG
jgi:small-conductance mechanosensitive channel